MIRHVRIEHWLDSVFWDCRFALRLLRKSPGFTVVAVLTLALGIGASSSVFSVVDRILFRSLPYPEDNRLVSFGLLASIERVGGEFRKCREFLKFQV